MKGFKIWKGNFILYRQFQDLINLCNHAKPVNYFEVVDIVIIQNC